MSAARISTCVTAALWLATSAGTLFGQAPSMPGRGDDFFNLGPTGAAGTPLAGKEAEAAGLRKAAGIRVDKVEEKTPASGHLQPGDVIVTAAGLPFPPREDPVLIFSRALEAAEAARTPVLKLQILRGGRPESVSFPVPATGKHSSTCPVKCAKCAQVVLAGLRFLEKVQEGDGSFPCPVGGINGKVAVTTLGGLAFLASGSTPGAGPFGSPLKKTVAYVMRNAGKERSWGNAGRGNMSQVNWNVGYSVWLLAEAYKATGDAAILEKIREIAGMIQKNQEASGGWAHGPGGPNALNYVELEIVSNYCLTSLGLARQLGVELDQEKVDLAIKYVVATSGGDGGVGYSTRQGQQGMGDAGRTAGAILAFHTLGLQRHPFYDKMNSYYRRNLSKLIGGHVSPCMHLLGGAFAARLGDARTWKSYVDTFRDEFMVARVHDGSFSARPTQESQQLHHNTDRGQGPAWTTAHFVLCLQAATGKLRMLGK